MFTWVLGHCVASTVLLVPSESVDRVGGQLCGGKECPFNGISSSGRVWRKVLESDAGSVCSAMCCLMQMHFVIGTEKQWFVASVLRHPRSLWHVEEDGSSRKVN